MTLADALALARRLGVARLDAQLLLAQLLQQPRSWLLAHDDTVLDTAQAERLTQLLQQRADAVPLAYLVGEREFHGLMLAVTPDVLVPRPETELLVDWAITLAPRGGRVLDLGTGSGAIALAIRHARPDLDVSASDLSPAALQVARDNARRHGLTVQWFEGPWWQPVAGRHFDLVVSNPPYIAGDDRHLPALRHEPLRALTPGGDGLDALRDIIAGAPAHLQPGGWLLVEHGHDQADAVAALFTAAGSGRVELRRDLAGHGRCSGARFV